MSYEFTTFADNAPLGNLAHAKWHELRKLLPLLVAFVNEATKVDWSSVQCRSITVGNGGAVPEITLPTDVPQSGTFTLSEIVVERDGYPDEVFVVSTKELHRLFAWCEFLHKRDGALALYYPSYLTLRKACAV